MVGGVSPRPATKRASMGLYAFRLTYELIGEVDSVAQQQEAERPGTRIARAEAVRILLVESTCRPEGEALTAYADLAGHAPWHQSHRRMG